MKSTTIQRQLGTLALLTQLVWLATPRSGMARVGWPVQPQRQKREKFGSSLDRLKWDPASNHAIEKGPRPQPEADSSVLKLSTLLVVMNALVTDSGGRVVTGLT